MGSFLTKGKAPSATSARVGTGVTTGSVQTNDPNKADENGVSYTAPDQEEEGPKKVRVQQPDGSYKWVEEEAPPTPKVPDQIGTSLSTSTYLPGGALAAGSWMPSVPANIETDGLVNTLDQAIQSGNNVVTANVQSQANQAANLGRLQAGAGTLGGNYAAAGAAAQGSEATMGQHVLQNAGLSAAQAGNDLESSYGQALSQSTNAHQTQQQETLTKNVQAMSDEIDRIKTQIAGRKDSQALTMQKYLDDVTAAMVAYRNAVAQGNASFQMVGDLYGGVLGAVSKVMAMA